MEPFLTAALNSGDRVVSYIYADMDPSMDISGYFTSGTVLKERPELVKSFQTAMNKSLKYAQDHPDEVRDIVSTYTKITKDVLKTIVLPEWRVDMSTAGSGEAR